MPEIFTALENSFWIAIGVVAYCKPVERFLDNFGTHISAHNKYLTKVLQFRIFTSPQHFRKAFFSRPFLCC